MELVGLFATGFIQVFLVSINTYFISKGFYIGIFITGFFISFVWSLNVKKICIGSMKERLIYSSGAAIGGLLGALLSIRLLS